VRIDLRNCCVILAAGEGNRMKVDGPKALCKILFEPMLGWVLDSAFACGIGDVCVVTGYKSEIVENYLRSEGYACETVFQQTRRGTADALITALGFISAHKGEDVLVLNGDSPFMDETTIADAYNRHKIMGNSATVISAEIQNSTGYGRIIRSANGKFVSITEECDATEDEKKISEVNSGAYWFRADDLLRFLGDIRKSRTGEFYLTSIIKVFIDENLQVGVFTAEDPVSVMGANNLEQLAQLNAIAKTRILNKLEAGGINIPHKEDVVIGKNVRIGEGTTILSDVTILKSANIGRNCIIGPGASIIGGDIEDNSNVIFRDISFHRA
jgi:bifunctional UDP-N-acetylglucosamine pyrophosphorylase/glucosamine-1-phosphate N-acetyltransferase